MSIKSLSVVNANC